MPGPPVVLFLPAGCLGIALFNHWRTAGAAAYRVIYLVNINKVAENIVYRLFSGETSNSVINVHTC